MIEKFAKPTVAAIIEKHIEGEKYILIQERQKEGGGVDNGKIELPAGKVREYESIFWALRREVREETGLTITKIKGENGSMRSVYEDNKVISFTPYYVTQNLSGAYSMIVMTFLCEADGTLLDKSNETVNIKWEKADIVKQMLLEEPEQFFLMHVNVLRKYFGIDD